MDMRIYAIVGVIFLLVSSCKKEQATATYDYSHYVGTYYGIRTKTTSFDQSSSSITSDYVMASSLSNNNIDFYYTQFNVGSSEQTSFSYYAPDYSKTAHLTFSNNYSDIGFSSSSNLGGGASGTDAFSGSVTQFPLTEGTVHPFMNDLIGEYVLNIHKHEYVNGIEEIYVDTIMVQMNNYNPQLDGHDFDFGRYISHCSMENVNQFSDEHLSQQLYWTTDSIYIEHTIIYGIFGGAIDTVHYTYSGHRL